MAKAEVGQPHAQSSMSHRPTSAKAVDSHSTQQQQAIVAATVPLNGLQLSPQNPLHSATRQLCPNCKKTRAFFCYDCLTPLMQGIPQLSDLPVTIHIVMHGETNSQATGTQAAMLAPIKLFRHKDGTSHHRRQPASRLQLPDWDPSTTAVLYPEGPNTPVVGLWGCLESPHQQQHVDKQQEQHKQQEPATTGDMMKQLQKVGINTQEQAAGWNAEQPQQVGPQLHAIEVRQELQQQLASAELQSLALQQKQQDVGCCQSCCDGLRRSGCCRSHLPAADVACSPSVTAKPVGCIECNIDSSQCSIFPYKTVVVLEGNWAKARTLLKHPKLAALPRIQLPLNVRSLFWRRGTGSFRAAVDCGVCTIEAVYLLLKQIRPEPAGQWDDLLWFFSYQRQLVQQKGSYQTRLTAIARKETIMTTCVWTKSSQDLLQHQHPLGDKLA